MMGEVSNGIIVTLSSIESFCWFVGPLWWSKDVKRYPILFLSVSLEMSHQLVKPDESSISRGCGVS